MECVKFKGRDAVRDVKVGGWLDHCYHGNMDINELFCSFLLIRNMCLLQFQMMEPLK